MNTLFRLCRKNSPLAGLGLLAFGSPRLVVRSRSPAWRAVAATFSTLALSSSLAHAQVQLPPIAMSSTGDTPAYGSGATGGQGGNLSGGLGAMQWVGSNGGSPSIAIMSTGGGGGTGQDGGDPTGTGGTGGASGQVDLVLLPQSQVQTATAAKAAIVLTSNGGVGGTAGLMSGSDGNPGKPGGGGDSGGVQVTQQGSVISTNGWSGNTPGTTAVQVTANGGAAAEPIGSDGAQGSGTQTGASGGTGGAGGIISYAFTGGQIQSAGAGLILTSQGGQGGDAYGAYSTLGKGKGGNGGTGGAANNVTVTVGQAGLVPSTSIQAIGAPTAATGLLIPIDAAGNTLSAAVMAAGMQAQSVGGAGGAGGVGDGDAGKGGAGGTAGQAGTVTLTMGGTSVGTTGFAAPGVLVQSIGGDGGGGSGAGGIFARTGGRGGRGGNGNTVNVHLAEWPGVSWPTSIISTTGDDSMGVVAQSIGGGGGAGGSVAGGSVFAGVSIGGSGESGGQGGTVSLFNGTLITDDKSLAPGFIVTTQGEHSSALVAQSIGGGGGSGGSATNTAFGAFAYTVGGNGGTGGNAGTPGATQVEAVNLGILSTGGDHAKGMMAQAVGGGGGDGGGAASLLVSGQLSVNWTVGGTGGAGGSAGDVVASNNGQILTSGADSWGMLAQSVSGGGGNGGMSTSRSFQVAGGTEVPSLLINASVGGNGGDALASGNITAANNGVIVTAGPGAHGLLAQSITGGGGNGGDSTALSVAAGKGTNLDITVALGGAGGGSSTAGTVYVDNSASSLIWTLGDGATGILAQSIGGGGGSGAVSANNAYFLNAGGNGSGKSMLTLGGSGGGGGNGGTVIVTSEGNIMTVGDGSKGIVAQSIGGGGGLSIGGTAKGSGGKLSQTISLGATGAAYGNGGSVNATNSGTIVTYGGDAAGIYAQSVGGGGGKAGIASTAGAPESTVSLAAYLMSSSVLKGAVASYGGVAAFAPAGWVQGSVWQMEDWAQDYLAYAAAQPANVPGDAAQSDTTVTTFLGGGSNSSPSGGAPTKGDGGAVAVTNQFGIYTFGPASAGIFAQSVGAGGGEASALSSSQYTYTLNNYLKALVAVGGSAQNSGNGGAVNTTNNGQITTQGDASFGILAQSIGGGGGQTAITANNYVSGDGKPSSIALGGANGTVGNGGIVTVANNAAIGTAGNDAVGIAAQSVGGGGGDVIFMQAAAAASGSPLVSVTNPLADATGKLTTLTVGSPNNGSGNSSSCPEGKSDYSYNSCGNGGAILVSSASASSISTGGRNAHGVLAQSIGGGGGWVVGLTQQPTSPFNKPIMAGDGGSINLQLSGTIATTGAGAYGVLAQTVGGGGILAGDLATATTPTNFPHSFFDSMGALSRDGNGGAITIVNSGTIGTTGSNAHAIFAQSVGGGGGVYAMSGGGVMMGSAGGNGNAGEVVVTNNGTVRAGGQGSSAIYIDTQGKTNVAPPGIYNNGIVWGNASAPAIVFKGGNGGNGDGGLLNTGFIANTNGTAVAAPDGFASVQNQATGQIYGNLQLGAKGTFTNYGFWGTNDNSTGDFDNIGTLNIWGANFNQLGTSVLNGNLTNSGVIQTSIDFYNKQASTLAVSGAVTLEAGTSVLVRPLTLAPNGPVTFLSGRLVGSPVIPVVDTGGSFLINYALTSPATNSLAVVPTSTKFFAQAYANTSNNNLRSLAGMLDATWSQNQVTASLAKTYASFSTISNAAQYISALTNIGNESAVTASAAHLLASNAFVERMNSCPRFEGSQLVTREHDCVWGRAVAGDANQTADSGSSGYHQSSQVLQFGGQKEVAPDWFLGASLSSDSSTLNASGAARSVSGHGWTFGAIAKRQMGDWLVSGAFDVGQTSYSSARQIQFPGMNGAAQGAFNVSHLGLHSRISKQIPFEGGYFKPYLDIHATHIDAKGYTEQGAGPLNLRAASTHTNLFGASPMLEAGTRFDVRGMTVQAYAGAGATFYNRGTLGTEMQFADSASNAASFLVTSKLPQGRFKTTAGLDLQVNDRLNVRLEYTGEFASHFKSNTAALKAAYRF